MSSQPTGSAAPGAASCRAFFGLFLVQLSLTWASSAWAAKPGNFDAVAASAKKQGAAADYFSRSELRDFRGQFNEQLDLPSFLTVLPGRSRPAGSRPPSSAQEAVAMARQQLKTLAPVYRITPAAIDKLAVIDQQLLPNGAALVRFSNAFDGIEVFRDRISVLLNADGSLNSLGGYVSGHDQVPGRASQAFELGETDALEILLAEVEIEPRMAADWRAAGEHGGYREFEVPVAHGQSRRLTEAARIKPVWFRTAEGLDSAYYGEVQLWDDQAQTFEAWSVVVSASSGELLFRNNLVNQETAFEYRVFAESNPPYSPLVGVQGRNGYPHPTGLPDGFQAAFGLPQQITLASAPFSMTDPWLPDGAVETVGNNVDAYADLAGPDGYQPGNGDLRAAANFPDSFDYTYDPSLAPGQNANQVQASVTQLFYLNNWLHDWFYDAGFDEAAGNAQQSNFGRGGLEGDPIMAEAQDYSGLNNANMTTPADGAPPRMQTYVFTGRTLAEVMVTGTSLNQAFAVGTAQFGSQQFNLTDDVVLSNNSGMPILDDACNAVGAHVSGKIALVDRGSCNFVVKAKNVQQAGAVGMLLANNQVSTAPPTLTGSDPTVTIPVLSLTQATGDQVKTQLGLGAVTANMVRTTAVNRDSVMDSSIVIHEWAHYLSNRLVMDSSGLSNTQGLGMGEGWSDFVALLALVQENDALIPANPDFSGVYAQSGYVYSGPSSVANPNNNYYYGSRRYPYSTNLARNPLTFKHIEDGIALPVSPAPSPLFPWGVNSQVHNTGEIWASALWECYTGLINDGGRLTFAEARGRMKTYLVAGLKMTPVTPTLVEARDALLAAMLSQDRDDFDACAAGFAKRGLGAAAIAPDRYSTSNSGVVESFGLAAPPSVRIGVINDATLTCDSDGVLDNLETGAVAITVRNNGFVEMSAATLSLSSPQPGAKIQNLVQPVGTLAPSQEVVLTGYLSPDDFAGISLLQIDAEVFDPDSGLSGNDSAQFAVHLDEVLLASATETFEVRELAWQSQSETTSSAWQRRQESGLDHRAYAEDIPSPGLQWLVSPPLQVGNGVDFILTFDARHSFEYDGSVWDGGVVEISTNDGGTWADIGASITPGYNGTIAVTANNPLGVRDAFAAQNAAWPAFDAYTVNLGTAYSGQTVRIRFGVGTDEAAGDFGWEIDNLAVSGMLNTPFPAVVAETSNCGQPIVFKDGFE